MAQESEAARLLREARRHSRLSQMELALAAGIAQSVISAYENGHREPSLNTLRRLVNATGQRLTIDIVPTRPLGLPDTPRGRLLRRHRSAIQEIAARYGASNIRVFGSVARGDDGPDSDIDLAADIPQDFSLVDLSGLGREVSELLDVEVDLVPTRSLRPHIAAELGREGVPL